MKTPTREQFEVVAEWCGVEIVLDGQDAHPHLAEMGGNESMRYYFEWKPHLPGIDSQRLMAALECDVYWMRNSLIVVSHRDGWIAVQITEAHDNTIDGKAAALASAVWQCAVKVAMEVKKA